MNPMTTAPDISVIIATRNRAGYLRECLAHLAAQETGGRFTYEVVIVDNGSIDATPGAVETLQPGFPVCLRYLYEGRAGKPWALNAGMGAARGAIFAFTDDDILPTPTWLSALWCCLQEERVDGVAGKVAPLWMGPRPAWLTDETLTRVNTMGLGCIDHGESRRRSADGQDCRWVGGNMAIRREVLQRLGPFDVRLLRQGGAPRGEDSEYYERCLRAGLLVGYEPSALAHHKIGSERLTLGYFRSWRHQSGYANAALLPWKASHLVTVMPIWRWRIIVLAVHGWLKAVATRRSWWERFYAELKVREELGVWRRRFQQWPREWLAVVRGRRE